MFVFYIPLSLSLLTQFLDMKTQASFNTVILCLEHIAFLETQTPYFADCMHWVPRLSHLLIRHPLGKEILEYVRCLLPPDSSVLVWNLYPLLAINFTSSGMNSFHLAETHLPTSCGLRYNNWWDTHSLCSLVHTSCDMSLISLAKQGQHLHIKFYSLTILLSRLDNSLKRY